LHDLGGEAEGTLPLGAIAREWELALITVPGSDEVDLLDIGSSERKAELNGRHY